ncbi:hypothetical protein YT1_1108 [Rhodococcus ruber]|nr:hypothetical protein YT1_1108 [Rhodococcus ruber]
MAHPSIPSPNMQPVPVDDGAPGASRGILIAFSTPANVFHGKP